MYCSILRLIIDDDDSRLLIKQTFDAIKVKAPKSRGFIVKKYLLLVDLMPRDSFLSKVLDRGSITMRV